MLRILGNFVRTYYLNAKVDSLEWIEQHDGIIPVKPRALVVFGRSEEWTQDEVTAFRILNDGFHGITVISFDHLLSRARQALNLLKDEDVTI